MDGAFDIPDSTDWLNTPLQQFSTLENALHCQICKEFYDTPMITSCSHTFCSKCIRTSLSTDGKCPACRTADQASKLRNNWALQEVVATFLAARPEALAVARKEKEALEQAKKPGKRKRTLLDSEDVAQIEQDARTTRRKSQRIAASQSSQTETVEEIGDSDAESQYEPDTEPDDGLVECPLGCGKRMKIEAVEPHLDRCEDERKQASRSKSRTPVNTTLGPPRPSTSKPQDRISELNYSLLTDAKLRRKLEELGLPAWGPKTLLVKRHTEWVNLWNANCDSNHPRTNRELLRELDTWERTQGGKAPNVNGLASSVMRKDFDGASWASRNRDDFSRLIGEARRKKAVSASEQEVEKSGENLDGANHVPPASGQPDRAPADKMMSSGTNEAEEKTTENPHSPPPSTQPPNDTTSERRRSEESALLEQNQFGAVRTGSLSGQHIVNGNSSAPCDLPAHLQSGSAKKMPMFSMPQVPVTDVDGGGGAQ